MAGPTVTVAHGAERGVEKFKQRTKVESGGNINESDQ
jgi:hypothetical protein